MRFHWQWLQARLETFNSRAVEKKLDEGLTLIEMLGVVVILGIVAAIAIPAISTAITEARVNTTESDLGTLQTALSRYYMAEGSYPANLTALATNPDLPGRPSKLWNGPYIRQSFPEHDAWGSRIYYAALPSGTAAQGYILVSGDGQTLTAPSSGPSLTLGSTTITSTTTGTVIAAAGGMYSGTYIGTRPNKDSLTAPLGKAYWVTAITSATFSDS